MFLLMVLSVEIYILKSSWVYNSNNDGNKPDMNIPLTYNSLNEWVATLLLITPHWKDSMVIAEVLLGWIPVLSALLFTVETVYYGGGI